MRPEGQSRPHYITPETDGVWCFVVLWMENRSGMLRRHNTDGGNFGKRDAEVGAADETVIGAS